MKIYLFPNYVSIKSAETFSPRLLALLQERGVNLEEAHWDGTLKTIPTGEPVIIRASSVMQCSAADLAQKCAQLGHFAFYDDAVIREDGQYDRVGLLEEARQFLDRVGITK